VIFKLFCLQGDANTKPEFKYRGPKEAQDTVVALYDYKAQRSDELDLKMGDDILVMIKENDSWWMGQMVRNGREGYFPASYVQEKTYDQAAVKSDVASIMRKKKTGSLCDLIFVFENRINFFNPSFLFVKLSRPKI
jgi:hypothetical protein